MINHWWGRLSAPPLKHLQLCMKLNQEDMMRFQKDTNTKTI